MTDYWTATDLGDDTGRAYADLLGEPDDEGRSVVSVVFNEGLRWHRENAPDLPLDDLTQRQLDLMAEVIETELGGSTKVGAWAAQDSDDPDEGAVDFSIEIALPPGFTDEDLHTAAWPFIATCINVTDPGAFGSPYVMNALREG